MCLTGNVFDHAGKRKWSCFFKHIPIVKTIKKSEDIEDYLSKFEYYEHFDIQLCSELKISNKCPIKKVGNSIFYRILEFFDFYDYSHIQSNLYLWYKCCYSIAFRTYHDYEKIHFFSDDIISLEHYIISFLKGQISGF